MTENISPARTRLLYMDFLRGFAILYIVAVRHLDDYAGGFYHNKFDDIMTYSLLGLFMFISGYLLTINNPVNSWLDFFLFIRKRFMRIYPFYVLSLILFMLCSFMSFKGVLSHMLLFNIFIDRSVMTLWFVSMICIFYIFYPIFAYKYSVLKTILISFLFCGLFLILHKLYGFIDVRVFMYLPMFVMGIVFSRHGVVDKFIENKSIVVFLFILFLICVFLYLKILFYNDIFLFLLMLFSVPCYIYIGRLFVFILNESIYMHIAYASFCMYLFHRVVFHLMVTFYKPNSDVGMVVYLTVLGVPIIFATSFYLQKYYDMLTSGFRRS